MQVVERENPVMQRCGRSAVFGQPVRPMRRDFFRGLAWNKIGFLCVSVLKTMRVLLVERSSCRAMPGAGLRRRLQWLTLLAMGGFAAGASAVEFKLATVAPDGTAWMREMRAGAELIEERTDGRVQFKFYPGGVMGNDAQVLRRMRVGQIHGGAFAVSGMLDRYSAISLYGVPLLIRSHDEIDYVRERMDPGLHEGLEDAGFISFGFIEGGFALMMANEPIRGVEDMRRRKVWIPEGDQASIVALEALGLSPVVLPITDVLTGLQTGLLDIVAASPTVALVLQWHTRIKYVTDLPVVYSMGIFALDARSFRQLSEEDQQIVRDVMTDVVQRLDRQARADNAQAREAMENMGIEFVPVDPADVSEWRATIAGTMPQMIRRNIVDARFYDQLQGLLDEYRRGESAGTGP